MRRAGVRMRVRAAVAVLAACWTAAASAAGPLPSPPGPAYRAVRALPPGKWLDLGPAAADPDWGRARGRAWTATMPYAPSLGGAFLYGEGVHAWWNRENGRYMDDLWLYDANGHRWVNLYPGTDMRNLPDVRLNGDGFEALPDGSPVPIAIAVHGYEMITWDPHRQLFYAMPAPHGYFKIVAPGIAAFREANRSRFNERNASPWLFDPWNREWGRLRTQTPSPASGVGDVLIYVPDMREVFFFHKGEVHFYDPAANRWRTRRPSGPPPPFRVDPVACHDPKRDRIYIGGGAYPVAKGDNALWIYDLAENRWIDPKPTGSSGGNHFGTNVAILNCDTVRDRVTLIRHRGAATGLYEYEPAKNAWADAPVPLPPYWRGRVVSSGFFHPDLGVHYVFRADDSTDNGRMMVYRPRR